MSVIVFTEQHPGIVALRQADERLGKLIAHVGQLQLDPREKPFESLVSAIVGQQLSTKAAAAIRSKVVALVGELRPESFARFNDDELRTAGLSFAKIASIRDLCARIERGELDLQHIHDYSNEQIIEQLVQVRGIGKWTAEMFMLFSLGRLDVLSFGDFGLQRSAKWLYSMPERKDKKYLEQHADRWVPYGGIASLYLWAGVDKKLVDSGMTPEQLGL